MCFDRIPTRATPLPLRRGTAYAGGKGSEPMSDDFYRIKRLPPYVIAEVNGMRAAARAGGEDIIDLGMGNPDLPPPDMSSRNWSRSRASPTRMAIRSRRAFPGLRRAQANYYGRRFGVDLDPETEVVVTMGSKEGLASLATAITAPGDVVLAPNPSYPIHTFGFIIAGATIRAVPTTPDEAYFESLERAMAFTVPRPSVLVVNYPSNPTAEDGRSRLLRAARRLGEARTRSGSSPTSPIRSSITTATRPPRSCR